MAHSVTHSTVVGVADDGTSPVGTNEWNAGHTVSLDTALTTAYKVGSFTRDMTAASGNAAITGVGFQPKAMLIFGGINVTSGNSIGLTDGSNNFVMWNYNANIAATFGISAAFAIILEPESGKTQTGTVTFQSDGFTVAWTKNGVPSANTATMFYIAFR